MHEISNKIPTDRIHFSREQYEFLNKTFPEVIPHPDDSPNKVFMQAGIRKMIYFVKDRVK